MESNNNNHKDENMDEEMQDKIEDLNQVGNDEEIIQEEDINKNEIDADINDNDNNIPNDYIEMMDEEGFFQKEYPNFQAEGEIYSIALHPPSSTLIIGDGADTTSFYNVTSKTLIKTEKINKDSVNFLSFSFDNKYLLSASVDGTINIFDPSNNFSILQTINDQDSEINWVEWHPKGPAFSFGTAEGAIWVYVLPSSSKNENFNFYSHNSPTTAGSFIKEGKGLVSVGEDCAAKVYELKTKTIKCTIKGKKYHQSPITCLAVSQKKPIFATGTSEGEFALANYESGTVLHFMNNSSNTNSEMAISIEVIEFCNNEQYVVFADSSSKVNVFDLSMMQIRSVINLNSENIIKMIPSKQTPYEMFACGSNGNVYIFDTRGNGNIVMKEKLHNDVIMDFLVTENEQFIMTSSLDKTINLVQIVNIN